MMRMRRADGAVSHAGRRWPRAGIGADVNPFVIGGIGVIILS